MISLVNVLLSGLGTGSIYIAISVGIVLVYRFTGAVNFAHGAVATIATYLAYEVLEHGHSYWLAALVAIVSGAVVSGALGLMMSKVFPGASHFVTAMATLGPGLALIGVAGLVWGYQDYGLRTPTALQGTVSIGSIRMSAFGLTVLGLVVLGTLALALYLRTTRTGVLLRAMSDSRTVAAINGVRVARFERVVWCVSGALAGAAGVVITPQVSLTPSALTDIMILSFAAAVLGGLASLGGLIVCGVGFGMVVALVQYFFNVQATGVTAFAILVLVLTLRPSGLFGNPQSTAVFFPESIEIAGGTRGGQSRVHRLADALVGPMFAQGAVLAGKLARLRGGRRRLPGPVSVAALAAGALVAVIVVRFTVHGPTIFVLATASVMTIGIAGQTVLSGLAGTFSGAQGAVMLLAAYVSGLLVVDVGADPGVGILAGVAAGAVVGVLLALAVGRLSGLYLGMITLVFCLALAELVDDFHGLTGGDDGLLVPGLSVGGWSLGSDTSLFLVCACCAVATVSVISLFKRSDAGLMMRASRDSERGAGSLGISAWRSRMLAFAIGGACAGLAGGLAVFQLGAVTSSSFGLWTGVYILFGAALGGIESTFVGPIVGGLFIALVPTWLSGSGTATQVIFGLTFSVALIVRQVAGPVLRRHWSGRGAAETDGGLGSPVTTQAAVSAVH
jgi:branched-chain amino acid transport system permease protein